MTVLQIGKIVLDLKYNIERGRKMKNTLLDSQMSMIRERLNPKREFKNESYARLLKRRRLEQNRTLEEVASGVCSTSYLCRIENAQVEVDDVFYEHLFEKLEMSYDEVKEQGKTNILKELLKRYLQDDIDKIIKLASDAKKSNIYSDIELKIISLFLNIVNRDYDQAKIIMKDIEKFMDTLIGDELVIYTYLSANVAFLTNNLTTSFKLVRMLESLELIDELVKEAINDLALSIYAAIDKNLLFMESYILTKTFKIRKASFRRILCHELEFLQVTGKDNEQKGFDGFKEIKETCENEDLLDVYYYNYIKFLLAHKDYEKILKICNKISLNSNILILLDYTLNKVNNVYETTKFLSTLKSFKFNKYENFIMYYNEYNIKKLENASNYELVDFLKQKLLSLKIDTEELNSSIIVKNILENYNQALFEIGKYKEIAKITLKY